MTVYYVGDGSGEARVRVPLRSKCIEKRFQIIIFSLVWSNSLKITNDICFIKIQIHRQVYQKLQNLKDFQNQQFYNGLLPTLCDLFITQKKTLLKYRAFENKLIKQIVTQINKTTTRVFQKKLSYSKINKAYFQSLVFYP